MADQFDLSIIIVNWNSAGFVRKCLESITANVKGLSFEILVVDNASFDGCEEVVSSFPEARYIQSEENLGFARANNLGFADSKGRNILFLNPDTEVVGTAIQLMAACLESADKIGMVGAKLVAPDGAIQMDCVRTFPSILNEVLDAHYLKVRFPKLPLWGIEPLFDVPKEPVRVEVISGACMMIKRGVFEKIGYFTRDYFMYSEDVDLCYKVKQGGGATFYVSRATILHHGAKSTSKVKNHFQTIMMKESKRKFMKLRRGSLYAVAYQGATACVAVFRVLLLGLVLVITLGGFERDAVLAALAKWTKVFRWAVGLETAEKKFV